MKTILIFSLLQFANVIFSTIRSILTIKGSKMTATISNALYFGYYTIVLVYMVADFPLWIKVLTTTLTNFVGVYLVKLFEERKKKDRIWKIESTVDTETLAKIDAAGVTSRVSSNSFPISVDEYVLTFYCYSQKESEIVIDTLKNKYNAKFFVTENRLPF